MLVRLTNRPLLVGSPLVPNHIRAMNALGLHISFVVRTRLLDAARFNSKSMAPTKLTDNNQVTPLC